VISILLKDFLNCAPTPDGGQPGAKGGILSPEKKFSQEREEVFNGKILVHSSVQNDSALFFNAGAAAKV
jgi:hypothetical protein